MSLNMLGHLVGDFVSHRQIKLLKITTTLVDHEQVRAFSSASVFNGNIQAAPSKDIEFLDIGAERVTDTRLVHRNDGGGIDVSGPGKLADILQFDGAYWKCLSVDYRPWRSYCRAIVIKLDANEVAKLPNAQP